MLCKHPVPWFCLCTVLEKNVSFGKNKVPSLKFLSTSWWALFPPIPLPDGGASSFMVFTFKAIGKCCAGDWEGWELTQWVLEGAQSVPCLCDFKQCLVMTAWVHIYHGSSLALFMDWIGVTTVKYYFPFCVPSPWLFESWGLASVVCWRGIVLLWCVDILKKPFVISEAVLQGHTKAPIDCWPFK